MKELKAGISIQNQIFQTMLETGAKKTDWAKNSLLVKNPQFWLYPHETWSKEQLHEVVIFTKCHEDRAKTVDFLQLVNFWLSSVFFAPVSKLAAQSLSPLYFKVC